jgi:hypothetical protein
VNVNGFDPPRVPATKGVDQKCDRRQFMPISGLDSLLAGRRPAPAGVIRIVR